MRWAGLLTLAFVLAPAAPALAHGGGCFRGPPGPPPPGCSEPWDAPPMPPMRDDGGPVTARVIDGAGEPLAGAWIWCEGLHVATTGALNGRFRCTPPRYPARFVVTAGDHAPLLTRWVTAPAPGGHVDLGDLVLASGEAITGDFADGAGSELMRLRVVPDEPRVPEHFAALARVTRWDFVFVRRGRAFSFPALPCGLYRLLLTLPDGREVTLARRIAPGGPRLRLSVPTMPAVPARVERLPADTAPAKGAVLVLTGVAGRIVRVMDRTSACQVFGRTEDGRMTVPVRTDSVFDVVTGDDSGLDAPLEGLAPGQEVALPPPAERRAIAGCVLRPDGSPVVHARVFASSVADLAPGPLSFDAETDAAGHFTLDGVAGTLRVVARAPGLTNDEHPCRVSAGDASVLVIIDEERLDAPAQVAVPVAER